MRRRAALTLPRKSSERRSVSRRRPDWIWIAVVVAVLMQIAVGLFMSMAAQGVKNEGLILPRVFAGYI